MNNRGEFGDVFIIFGAIVWFVIMWVVFSADDTYDEDCLNKIAEKYCDKLKLDYIEDYIEQNSFQCGLKTTISDERNYNSDYEFTFEFLDKEKEKCEIKDEN